MKIEVDNGKFKLQFGYKSDLVAAIKDLPDRQYNPNDKTWTVGFDESNLQSILAMLAGNNFPAEMLNEAEREAKLFLQRNPATSEQLSENEYTQLIKPTIMMIGELVLEAYKSGKINQKEQVEMLNIINHLSLKDFITK